MGTLKDNIQTGFLPLLEKVCLFTYFYIMCLQLVFERGGYLFFFFIFSHSGSLKRRSLPEIPSMAPIKNRRCPSHVITLHVSPATALTSDTSSHGIRGLQQRLFEPPQLEYWLLNMTNKIIFNLHNHDLACQVKLCHLFDFLIMCNDRV